MDDAPVIELCFCPPMPDPDDPEQHRAGCYHAEVLYRQAFWDGLWEHAVKAMFPLVNPSLGSLKRNGPQPASACYEASFGWVHVRPQCRCTGGRR